mmetsp:Transcript_5187/g.9794  ORF Transcript_5187/g.9794 Transcript_5187/m.9794 type:complete len:844 (+) Transcript_5187:227-2758(+)
MTQHFAASWLQSLSGKLESLTQWSWTSNKQGSCATHRNLFREFFTATFQKTLALVDETKKTEFLKVVERNLYKFDELTQQFPLGCLCALLQHGKDSALTQEKVAAWVDFLLERLHSRGWERNTVSEVVEECMSPQFQKFLPLMEEALRGRLADGLGRHLEKLGAEMQSKVLEGLPPLSERAEHIMASCTKELNQWLESAPRFPSTPMVLADTLMRMEHPLLKFFTAVKDANKKESFLVAVALALQGLRTRFRWMCAAELDLESLGKELQRRFFTVEGQQGPVMEMWLSSRLKKYNIEVATRTANLMAHDPIRNEQLRRRLEQLFPGRSDTDSEAGWLHLDGPTRLADALLNWLTESSTPAGSFFCPQHTVARETLFGLLQRFGRHFETDPRLSRARLNPRPSPESTVPSLESQAQTPKMLPASPAVAGTVPGQIVLSAGPPKVPLLLKAPPAMGLLPVRPTPPPLLPIRPVLSQQGGEVDNLVDLLLNEALDGMSLEMRSKILKLGHGVYRFGTKEVTLHTQNGRLFVYRIGEVVRQVPFQTLLQEEGLLVTPKQKAVPALTPGASGVADASSVARIALQAKQISAGVTTTVRAAALPPAPFGSGRPADPPRTDPQALMSKRVEAATKAMDVSKQIVRRSVNFDDDKLLRKLLSKGLKRDEAWLASYEEYCTARGVSKRDQRHHDKDFVATFIEQNLANSISKDWAKKIIYAHDGDKKEKKDKKDKKEKDKDKRKKDKKRKASDSSSSNENLGSSNAASSGLPMDMPMAMSVYGHGMPMAMGGMMGHLGNMMPMHLPMLGDVGMPGVSAETEDHRTRKRAKPDRGEKDKEKTKKSDKVGKASK